MGLQRLERRLERFVEGTFARVFRSGLQPVEIGRRLTREIDLRRTIAPRGVLAPNSFSVLVSEADRAKLRPIEDELVKELVEMAASHAHQEGYTFLGPVSVTLETDEFLRPGTLLVAGEMTPSRGAAALELPDGRRVLLERDKVTLGRLPECELALADSGVSRRHAEVRRGAAGTWSVADLGSTNGTKVNGARITGEHQLRDGDEVTVGATTVRFQTEPSGEGPDLPGAASAGRPGAP